MSVTYSENTQTMRGLTISETNTYAAGDVFLGKEDLLEDIGAPWEIHIKSVARDSGSAWGTSTYGSGGNTASGVPTISQADAEALGNDIHRVLKYYLQTNRYIVSNIEAVRLNIALKYDDIESIVYWNQVASA